MRIHIVILSLMIAVTSCCLGSSIENELKRTYLPKISYQGLSWHLAVVSLQYSIAGNSSISDFTIQFRKKDESDFEKLPPNITMIFEHISSYTALYMLGTRLDCDVYLGENFALFVPHGSKIQQFADLEPITYDNLPYPHSWPNKALQPTPSSHTAVLF